VDSIEAELDLQIEPDVMRERIRVMYEQLTFAVFSNIAISAGLTGLLWSGGRHGLLIGWLSAVLALGLARAILLQRFKRQMSGSFDVMHWARLYAFMALLSGALLGSAGILFYQSQLLILIALAVVLGVMSIGSIMMHAAYAPAHLAYVLPLMLPFALYSILELELLNILVGLVVLLFLPINLYLARKIQNGLIESISLRFRNQLLIRELLQQKEIAVAAQSQAEQANAAKTRFFAAASHDLRQPVQALELFSAALEFDLKSHPSRHLVGNIRAVGQEFGELLGTLLEYSKIDAAAVQPELRDFPVAALLKKIANEFKPQATARGLQFRMVKSSAWVRSDPFLLERVVRNFMSNAIKYTPKGKILLGCRRADGGLRIEVHDTGIGIAQNQQKTVFSEFVQLENPERDRHKGLGLGLAIVDGLARVLAHPLTLHSKPQRGSMFAVTVPLGVPVHLSDEAVLPAIDKVSDVSILLMDDDQAIRDASTQLLEKWGYVVVTAESTSEALELLRSTGFRPDAMLIDFRLREGRNGVEAIHAIREFCGQSIPAAIFTGDTDPSRLNEVKAAGFPILHKPLPAAKLRALLSNLLYTPAV
jgi:signal transduction histidine kinase/CheY-like chemotaxis protein